MIKTLLDRKLVTAAGRKEVIGRPILYKTTRDFLIHFGLKGLDELPSIEEFEELIKTEHSAEQAELPLDEPEGIRRTIGRRSPRDPIPRRRPSSRWQKSDGSRARVLRGGDAARGGTGAVSS